MMTSGQLCLIMRMSAPSGYIYLYLGSARLGSARLAGRLAQAEPPASQPASANINQSN